VTEALWNALAAGLVTTCTGVLFGTALAILWELFRTSARDDVDLKPQYVRVGFAAITSVAAFEVTRNFLALSVNDLLFFVLTGCSFAVTLIADRIVSGPQDSAAGSEVRWG
jgi:hypothetical protein